MASYSFPWSDGSSDIIEVLVGDGLVGDISVSCVGHSLRSDCRRRTLTLTNADGVSVHIMVSQFHDSVLSMVFRIGGGDSVLVDSDSSEVVIPLTGSVTITSFVSDGQGGVVAKDVSWPLGSSTYGSLFSITHSGSLGSLIRLESTAGAVNVVVGKNVDGIFGNESFVCRFTGYGFDEESAPVSLVLETNLYDITGIRLLCSTDGVSWASSASLLSSGGLVYFQYELLRSFRDGRSDSYVVGVGSSELGGSLFVGNAEYPYSDRLYRSYWSSYRFNPNIEPADLTQPVRWTFMGFSSSVSVTLAGAIVVVDSWLELSMSPVWCDASGISGSFTALKYERLSDLEGTVRLAQDFTSVAVLRSSGSWLSGSGGSFVVSAYTGRDGDRSVGVTVTAGGLTSEVVYFTQERLMTDEYYAPVISFSYPVISSDGGSVSPVISSIQQEWLRGATNTREVLSLSLSDLSSVVWSVSGVGATIDSSTGVVIWSNNTVTESRSADVTVSCVSNGVSGGGRASSVQEAYVPISYGVPEGLVLSVGDIPASGGSVSSGVLSGVITQTKTQGSVVETLSYSVSDISGSYSAAVSAGSLGEVESARSKVGTLVYSFILNGVTGYAEADVYQAANVATYTDVSISGGSVGDIPASGGTVSASGCSASQSVSFTSGIDRECVVGLSYSSVSADSLGTTDKARAKVGVSVCTAEGEGGLSATKSFDVYQAANVATYTDVSISDGSVSDIPAGGGTVSASGCSVSQSVSFTSGDSRVCSVTVAYSSVSADSLGVTPKARTKVGVSICTAEGEGGLSATKTFDVYQAANVASYGDIVIDVSGVVIPVIPASGGTVSASGCSASQTVTYTSGDSRYGELSESYSSVSADSLGKTTTYSRKDIGDSVYSVSGEGGKEGSRSFTVQQAINNLWSDNVSLLFDVGQDGVQLDALSADGGTVRAVLSGSAHMYWDSGSEETVVLNLAEAIASGDCQVVFSYQDTEDEGILSDWLSYSAASEVITWLSTDSVYAARASAYAQWQYWQGDPNGRFWVNSATVDFVRLGVVKKNVDLVISTPLWLSEVDSFQYAGFYCNLRFYSDTLGEYLLGDLSYSSTTLSFDQLAGGELVDTVFHEVALVDWASSGLFLESFDGSFDFGLYASDGGVSGYRVNYRLAMDIKSSYGSEWVRIWTSSDLVSRGGHDYELGSDANAVSGVLSPQVTVIGGSEGLYLRLVLTMISVYVE